MSLVDRLAALFREDDDGRGSGIGSAPTGATDGGDDRHDGDSSGSDGDGGDGGDDRNDGDGGDDRNDGDGGDDRTVRELAAVVDRSPEGVRTYTASLVADGGTLEAVEPGALERHFQVREGGAGEGFVRVRAVDFGGEARRVDGGIVLFTVRLTEPVPAAAVSLTVESMVDHADERVPTDRVRLTVVA